MTVRWAVRFPRLELAQVGRLWGTSGVEVCQEGEEWWLRGSVLNAAVREQLKGFLSGKRLEVLPDGQLRSPQAAVPLGYLPEGPWAPLQEWMTLEMPPAAWAGQLAGQVLLRLVSDPHPVEPDVLLTDTQQWLRYASHAPLVRLRPLRFAVASSGQVLVLGQPLPSMPGRRLVNRGGIAVPAGQTWSPAIDAAVVRELLGLSSGDVALWDADDAVQRIAADELVPATRQAVRASCCPEPTT